MILVHILAGKAGPSWSGPRGYYHASCLIRSGHARQPVRRSGEIDRRYRIHREPYTRLLRLSPHRHHEINARDRLRKSGEVLHLGGFRELSAGKHAFDDETQGPALRVPGIYKSWKSALNEPVAEFSQPSFPPSFKLAMRQSTLLTVPCKFFMGYPRRSPITGLKFMGTAPPFRLPFRVMPSGTFCRCRKPLNWLCPAAKEKSSSRK